ncbi:MAG TPA: hypothetical protein VFV66_15640 [Nonomuraea sp.]|nr:hypothetical protein [Nonomuraea sp.]
MTDGKRDAAARRRARAIRISVVVAGLLNLGVAALLIGVPGRLPTLHPVPDDGTTASPPPGMVTVHPDGVPVGQTPHPPASAPRAEPGPPRATRADHRARPPGTDRPAPRPTRTTPSTRTVPVAARTTPGNVRATPPRADPPPRQPARSRPARNPVPDHSPDARPNPPGRSWEPPGHGGQSPGQPPGRPPAHPPGPAIGRPDAPAGNRPDPPPGLAR